MTSTTSAERPSFWGVSALLFAASAAGTIGWCASMSMGEMRMPGGWTMSMAWMRMPGQTWFSAATSFLGMWVVMMVAMMLPSLLPMLRRYRAAVRSAAGARLGRLTVVVGVGYFFVWTLFGMAAFPLGVALAALEMRLPPLARAVPFAVGAVVLLAGLAPAHRLESTPAGLLPGEAGVRPDVAGRCRYGVATRVAPGRPLQPLLRRSDGDPPLPRDHGPARDGGRDGRDHRRTSRLGR